ncbi:MAG: L,D-transpeptidase [Lachnospiraceae bacterium]|jgi:hypothetical protein|nr:L,D-transpeptidase [Lachnospiraceae bacterium]
MKRQGYKGLRILKIMCMIAVGLVLGTGLFQMSAKAASGYVIKINKQANCVTIYKENEKGQLKPVKALICSTGYATKLGTYSLGEKLRWHVLDGPCYGQYCTRIYGGVLFHSVWYTGQNNPATLSISSYNKLGTTASHGCVRLTVAGAKWIYDNVPSGTKVIIYSDPNPGPLGKPRAIKLPYTYAWDPTDTGNPSNPWNSKKPSITGAKNQTVDYNAKFDIMKGITAKNTTGFDAKDLVTTKIMYQGKKVPKVDTTTPGKYKVTYVLIDEIERKATAKAVIKVTAPREKPVISGVKNVYVTAKKKLTKSFLLKGVTIKQAGKKLPAKYVTVEIKKTKQNVYKITYTAKRSSIPTVVTAKAYIDTKAPVISGITDGKTYETDATIKIDEKYARSLIKKVSDNLTSVKASDVAVKITKLENGAKYKVVYTLSDEAGNQCKVTIYLVPVHFVSIEGPDKLELTTGDLGLAADATSSQLKTALTHYLLTADVYKAATTDGNDLTEELTLELTEKEGGVYHAVLTATDGAGHFASKTVIVTVTKKEKEDLEGSDNGGGTKSND